MTKYIRVPFADSGDKADVPVASASDGSVSFVQGYPIAYSLDPETDTAAKRIERPKMNFLFNQITAAIQEMQQGGVAPYITADDNGGSAYAYAQGAVVLYNGVVYQSLVANNTQLPTVAANWSPLSNQGNSVPVISANATGDLNTVIATGVYSVTAAATNGPLAQTAVLEVYQRTSGAVVQVWHSASATASVQNRHYVRTGVISGGVATSWSAWTQLTLRPVELSSGQDLNALTESGIYTGSSFSNAPSAIGTAAAFVEVTAIGGGASIRQKIHAIAANTMYARTYTASAWTAWKQIVTSDDNPGRLLNVQRFTASGTYTPTPGAKVARSRIIGAGGGGGGCPSTSSTQQSTAGGGQSGGYAEHDFSLSASSYVVTVGAGGTRGVAGGAGGNGGLSSIAGVISVPGGNGGYAGSAVVPTATIGSVANSNTAPTVTTGTLRDSIPPAAGQPAFVLGSGTNQAKGGTGGNSPLGLGGQGGLGGAPGLIGQGFGAGGGGCSQVASNAGDVGGAGTGGYIEIWEFA